MEDKRALQGRNSNHKKSLSVACW